MIGRALALLALALLLTGCGRDVERIAERKVNGLLPEYLGPADRYATRVQGNPGALLRGRLDSVHVEGAGVRLSEELTLDTLALDLVRVNVDTKAGRLRGVDSVAFFATVGEANLNRYVRARRPDIPGLRVALGEGKATVYALPELPGAGALPIAVDGLVTPRAGGGSLDFTPGSAHVSVVPVPGLVLDYLARHLNPVVDLSTLRTPVQVDKAEVKKGALLLRGSVDPAALLRAGSLQQPPRRGAN